MHGTVFQYTKPIVSGGLAASSHQSRSERLQVASQMEFGEVSPRTMCSSAPPRAFPVGQVQPSTAPCLQHFDEGEGSNLRLLSDMELCSRDLGEKTRLDAVLKKVRCAVGYSPDVHRSHGLNGIASPLRFASCMNGTTSIRSQPGSPNVVSSQQGRCRSGLFRGRSRLSWSW